MKPLSTAVALVFARIESLRSRAACEAERGSTDENEAGFWIVAATASLRHSPWDG